MDLASVVLGTLARQDAVTLAGVDAELFDLESARPEDATSWLRDVIAFVSGELTYDKVIVRRLRDGRPTAALRVAAGALARGVEPAADTERELDVAWTEIRTQAEKNRRHVKDALARVSIDAPFSAAAARRDAEPLETLRLSEGRPRMPDEVDSALSTLDAIRRIREAVDSKVEAAGHEAHDFRRRLREAALGTAAQLMDRLAMDRDSSGRTATLLRALPELILSRRLEELERLAMDDVDEEFFRQVASSAVRPPSVRPPPISLAPLTERARVPVQLSLTSRALLESVREIERPIDDVAAVERAMKHGASDDAWRVWLEVAKSAKEETTRLRALGEGLFLAGKYYFIQQGQVRLAIIYLRDALVCLARVRAVLPSKATERIISGLLASTVTSGMRDIHDCRSWWDNPEMCFEWIDSTGHFELVGRLWAETNDDAAANEVFAVASAMLGLRPQFYAACARSLVTAQRLRSDPDLVIHRMKQLIAPVGATPQLDAACDDLAHELGSLRAQRVPGIQVERALVRILEGLEGLHNDKTAPIHILLDVLPEAVRPLVSARDPNAVPAFRVLQQAGTLYPEETNGDMEVPLLVQAMEEGSPVDELVLEVAIEDEHHASQVLIEDAEVSLGSLDPGDEVELRIRMHIPLDLGMAEIRLRTRIRNGTSIYADALIVLALGWYRRRGARSPYSTGTSVSGAQFVGRDKERRKILDALLGEDVQRTPLIVGIRRIGKTSLLKVLQESDDLLLRYNPVYYSPEDRPGNTTSADILRILAERIREGVPQSAWKALNFHREAFRTGDPFEAFETFCSSVNQIKLQRRVLLIIDEFDRLVELARIGEQQQDRANRQLNAQEVFHTEVFGALRKVVLAGGNISFVFAGLPALLDAGYRDRLFGLLLPVHIGSLRPEEANLILDATQGMMRFAPNAKDRIFLATGLQPYLLQLICDFLFARMIESGREIVTVADVDEVIADDILTSESYFTDYKSLVPERMVEVLSAMHCALKMAGKRRFVSVHEIAHVLNRSGTAVRVDELRTVLDGLSNDTRQERPLVTRAPNAPGRYRLTIGMLGDHLDRTQAYFV